MSRSDINDIEDILKEMIRERFEGMDARIKAIANTTSEKFRAYESSTLRSLIFGGIWVLALWRTDDIFGVVLATCLYFGFDWSESGWAGIAVIVVCALGALSCFSEYRTSRRMLLRSGVMLDFLEIQTELLEAEKTGLMEAIGRVGDVYSKH